MPTIKPINITPFVKKFQDYFPVAYYRDSKSYYSKKTSSNCYLIANNQIVQKNKKPIQNFLKTNNIKLLIPLKEKRDTVKNLLSYAEKRLPPASILIINDESTENVKKTILSFKKTLVIDKEEILKILDWRRLLPILNLKTIPKGKGTTVMTGYLFMSLFNQNLNPTNQWIFQTDADIKNPEKFKPLEYLTYGILSFPQALQIKIAQGGRNNEAHMAVRSSLIMLKEINKIIPSPTGKKLSQRAVDLFYKLTKYKWILGGTFALPYSIAMQRPFATGYLEETLTCAFVEDLAQQKQENTVQITNPHPCQDSPNDFKKENIIVQTTANFLLTLLLTIKPVNEWCLEDIAWINKNLLSTEKPIALIPPAKNQHAPFVEKIPQERIFPSIKMLFENKFILESAAKKLKEKYNFWRFG